MKQYHQYKMDFSGKWVACTALCMALSLFLSALYYLGFRNLKDIGTGELIFCLWLPLILGVAYIALMCGVRRDAPGIYGLMGAVYCVLCILGSFTGSAGRGVLAIPAYLLCALALLIVVGGFFPAKLPAMLFFGAVIVLRILFFDLGRLSWLEWIKEAAVLFGNASFMILPLAMRDKRRKKRS